MDYVETYEKVMIGIVLRFEFDKVITKQIQKFLVERLSKSLNTFFK